MRPRPLLAVAIAALAVTCVTTSAVAGDWLTIRRGGVDAILDAARSAQATKAWGASYKAKVAKGHPLEKIRVHVAWRPRAVAKGVAQRYESVTTITGLKGGKAGVATVGDKTWTRLPGGKVSAATGKALTTVIPKIAAPLMLFATLAMTHAFDTKLEGEFGGTAVMRLNAKYAGMQGLTTCKLGVSKRNRFAEMAEVGVGDGGKDVKLAWFNVALIRGQLIPDGLRLMRDGGTVVVDFDRVGLKLGKSASKLKFGTAALR